MLNALPDEERTWLELFFPTCVCIYLTVVEAPHFSVVDKYKLVVVFFCEFLLVLPKVRKRYI